MKIFRSTPKALPLNPTVGRIRTSILHPLARHATTVALAALISTSGAMAQTTSATGKKVATNEVRSFSGATAVNPAEPSTIVAALQELGYQATLETASDGDPQIRSSIEGMSYLISFYGCKGQTGCGALNFLKGFDLADGFSSADVNRWNRTKLVGRVYLDDERDPFIDMFVEARGGVSKEVFKTVVARWGIALNSFRKEIGW